MNIKRKQSIRTIVEELRIIRDKLYDILTEEEIYYDNIPENLLGTERAEISEESVDLLSDAIDNLEEVIEL